MEFVKNIIDVDECTDYCLSFIEGLTEKEQRVAPKAKPKVNQKAVAIATIMAVGAVGITTVASAKGVSTPTDTIEVTAPVLNSGKEWGTETSTAYTTDYLRARMLPSLDGEIISVYPPDTAVNIINYDPVWCLVEVPNGNYYYMATEYLDFENGDDTVIVEDIDVNTDDVDIDTEMLVTPEEFQMQGVLFDGGYRYTWYSENVLPGGGLDIPGRHTDDYGYVRDVDNYICVASDSLDRGTIVSTPVGSAKVYDCGCGADDIIDVYTAW